MNYCNDKKHHTALHYVLFTYPDQNVKADEGILQGTIG